MSIIFKCQKSFRCKQQILYQKTITTLKNATALYLFSESDSKFSLFNRLLGLPNLTFYVANLTAIK
jgi:hypothetical protein